MNVISASRRTDIPAFYWRWFMRRLDAGYCEVANPFNASQVRRVSLKPEDVAAFVFWTRDATQLLKDTGRLHGLGYRFYVHYTLTGYPRELERHSPTAGRAVRTLRSLSDAVGPERVIWRYDPIIPGSAMSPEYHLENFTELAEQLCGAVRDVYISFCEPYAKTKRRLAVVAEKTSWSFELEKNIAAQAELATRLAEVATAHGMQLYSCSQPDLAAPGLKTGRCVDPGRIRTLRPELGLTLKAAPTRPGCGCAESIDIGAYDTCAFGCEYCYATSSSDLPGRRLKEHDPADSFLQRPREQKAAMKGEFTD